MKRITASMGRRYDDKASRLAKAISKLASNRDTIANFESYVAQHGDDWYNKYASDLDGLISELENFASMYNDSYDIESSTSIKCSTVIDFAEHRVTKNDVSDADWEQLQHTVNFDYYDSLQQMAQDLVNVIEDDTIWSEIEWNIFHAWYDEKGFTEDDWDYVEACGYERDQFDPDRL